MKLCMFSIILLLLQNIFAGEVSIFGETLLYEVPSQAIWNKPLINYDDDRSVGSIVYTHNPIMDSEGRSVSPVMAIIYEKLSSDSMDLIIYSTIVRMRQGVSFEIDSISTAEDMGMNYHNSIYYDGYYYRDNIKHEVIVVHMVKGNIGIQIICDSTDEVYSQVFLDMQKFVQSIKFK